MEGPGNEARRGKGRRWGATWWEISHKGTGQSEEVGTRMLRGQ